MQAQINDMAQVFDINPVVSDLTITELKWVADDMEGKLTAEEVNGLRKIKVVSCVDEGETNFDPFFGEQRICSLRQLANKEINGKFIYDALLNAKNTRIIALTGTPIQKDQYELGLLMNVLRGKIEIYNFRIERIAPRYGQTPDLSKLETAIAEMPDWRKQSR